MAKALWYIALTAAALLTHQAYADDNFRVASQTIGDEKAVFATVESANIVPARVRIGGTVVQLVVRQGDRVEQDQPVATVADKKFVLQIQSLDAQIAGLQAQFDKAKTDLERAQELFAHGTTSKVALDSGELPLDIPPPTCGPRRCTAPAASMLRLINIARCNGSDTRYASFWRGFRLNTITILSSKLWLVRRT